VVSCPKETSNTLSQTVLVHFLQGRRRRLHVVRPSFLFFYNGRPIFFFSSLGGKRPPDDDDGATAACFLLAAFLLDCLRWIWTT